MKIEVNKELVNEKRRVKEELTRLKGSLDSILHLGHQNQE